MDQFFNAIFDKYPVYLLAGLRMSGLFFMSPVFGRKNVPAAAKIGLTLLLTYMAIMNLPSGTSYSLDSTLVFTLDCVKEIVLGFSMGYLTTLFFSAAMTAGEMTDIQIGFGMSAIFDPQIGTQVPMFGNLLNLLALLLFFAVDGHHSLIRILIASFDRIPPGRLTINPDLAMMVLEYFVNAFVLAVQIALPVIAVSLLAEAALAVIMRTVPQMNVFVVGMPLKVILGLVILIIMLPVYRVLTDGMFDQMTGAIQRMFEGFAAG